MALARMIQPTSKRLFGFGDGCHNLALTQGKKYQLPLEKSGFRSFRNWSCYETNLNQTVNFLSQISLSPSPPRSVWSVSLSTVANYGIGHREKQYCQSNPSQLGPQNRGLWQTKCAHGMRYLTTDEFAENVTNKFRKSLSGNDYSNDDSGPSKEREKRGRDSDTDSAERDSKRLNLYHGGESNSDETKSANALANVMSSVLAVHVDLEKKGDGEYVLNIKRETQSSTADDKVERAEQMAQKAAVLLLYGEMLLHRGNKLRAQSLASLRSECQRSNSESD